MHTRSRECLGLSHLRPFSVSRGFTPMLECGQADNIEREVSLCEELAPIGDHYGKYLAILESARRVLFALIPECSSDGKMRNWRQHSFVKHTRHHWPVLVTTRERIWRARVQTELPLPRPS